MPTAVKDELEYCEVSVMPVKSDVTMMIIPLMALLIMAVAVIVIITATAAI